MKARTIGRLSALGGALVLVATSIASCGGSASSNRPRLESNTNWLQRCDSDTPCSGALSCLCGMCTQPCAEAAECGRLAGATCSSSCGDAPGAGMCVLSCSSDVECGAGFECRNAECRPTEGMSSELGSSSPESSPDAGVVLPTGPTGPTLGDTEQLTSGPCKNAFVSMDSLYALAREDLAAQPAQTQTYLRYASLANRANAAACPTDLDALRSALGEALNSTSLTERLNLPVAVDASGLLYRVDLRDYAWERALTVSGVSHANAWEALSASTAFAVALTGPDADPLRAATGSEVPVLPADALVYQLSQPELYLPLIDTPATLDALLTRLGVDAEANRASGAAARAGTTASRISRQDRYIERQPIAGRPGVWITFDFASENPRSQGFTSPIELGSSGGAVVYPLPNSLPGYAIFDAAGALVPRSEILMDTNQDSFQATAAISCVNCHAQGLIGVADEVRDWVEASPELYSAEERTAVARLYPRPSAWFALVNADNGSYRASRVTVGANRIPNPWAVVSLRFSDDVQRSDKAADLMLPEAAATAELTGPEPESRQEFAASFQQRLCVSLASARNQPRNCAAR